jgi:hypothetical protein
MKARAAARREGRALETLESAAEAEGSDAQKPPSPTASWFAKGDQDEVATSAERIDPKVARRRKLLFAGMAVIAVVIGTSAIFIARDGHRTDPAPLAPGPRVEPPNARPAAALDGLVPDAGMTPPEEPRPRVAEPAPAATYESKPQSKRGSRTKSGTKKDKTEKTGPKGVDYFPDGSPKLPFK